MTTEIFTRDLIQAVSDWHAAAATTRRLSAVSA